MKRITRILMVMGAGVLMLTASGCTTMKDIVKPREDITDFTKKGTYQATAKAFLDDETLAARVPTDVPDYCKGISGETGQKFQNGVFKAASLLDKFGGKGFSGKDGLVSKPKVDFTERYFFCQNFLNFESSLTPDERRKLLIFLGKDYFSANWMQEKFAADDFRKKMTISTDDKAAIQDVGFAPPPTGEGLQRYLQQRIDWQTRNSGIALLGLFNDIGVDKELGPMNPASLEEMKRRYELYRKTGFTWFTTDRIRLAVRAGLMNQKTFTNQFADGRKQVIDVWGGIEVINRVDSLECLHNLFERFPIGDEVRSFYFELGKKEPDMTRVKAIAVDSVTDELLQEAKRYAKWLADGKPNGTVAADTADKK